MSGRPIRASGRRWAPVILAGSIVFGCVGNSEKQSGSQVDEGLLALPNADCIVTTPGYSAPPGELAGSWYTDGSGIWTALARDGHVAVGRPGGAGRVLSDGSLEIKWPWWREVDGDLHVSGHLVQSSSAALLAFVPSGYGTSGFQATSLTFPEQGCWEITGSVGPKELTVVVLIARGDGVTTPSPRP
jgi:hypothetical protein